jgi:hypothetical protein
MPEQSFGDTVYATTAMSATLPATLANVMNPFF